MNNHKTNKQARIGIVLSSGGIRGVYAHTGFIQALAEMGIKVSAVTGCSAGAIVGGIYASGKNMQAWTKTLASLNPRRFWRPQWFRMILQLLLHRGKGLTGLSSMEAAREFCKEQIEVERIEDCKIPFKSLAMNIETETKEIFSKGDLASAIVASAAIPIVYQPVKIEDKYYLDGALEDFAPTDAICCQHNLDILILHYVASDSNDSLSFAQMIGKPWTIYRILGKLLYKRYPWYLTGKPISLLHCPCQCGTEIIVIEPKLDDLSWPLTDTGINILESAKKQTVNLLAPYRDNINQGDKKDLVIKISRHQN